MTAHELIATRTFKADRAALKAGLARVAHAVATRSPLPALSHILLTPEPGGLRLAATNLEITMIVRVAGETDAMAAPLAVPAKLLVDLVQHLPQDHVELDFDEERCTCLLTCARTQATIKAISGDEFPSLEGLDPLLLTTLTTIPADVLRATLNQVVVAAATEDARPILKGMLLRLRDDQVTFIATDGFRLASRALTLAEAVSEPQDLILPAHGLLELARVLDDNEAVSISVTPSLGQVVFTTPTLTFVSRVLEGRFPDYERIIPVDHATRTTLDRAVFAAAVKRTSVLAEAGKHNVIKLLLEPGTDEAPGRVTLTADAAEVGAHVEVLDARISGTAGQIALNAQFLQDAIESITTDSLMLETQTPASPGVIRPHGSRDYVHLVMPMSVR
jgi:DNA polymerase-3 subunit beta